MATPCLATAVVQLCHRSKGYYIPTGQGTQRLSIV